MTRHLSPIAPIQSRQRRLGTFVLALLIVVTALGLSGVAPSVPTTLASPGVTDLPQALATQDEPLAERQEITVGISRNLVNGEEDFLYAHASLQVWEPLIRYDNELRIYPGLAERWTLSEDGLTWTFELRRDVNFSDGNPFNAEAAVANIRRFETVSGRPSIFLGGINFPEIYGAPVSVEAVDEYTFEISYAEPRPLLPYSIANHYSAIFSPASFEASGDFVGLPTGSGPYRLVDWQRDQYAILERNEDYWSEKPTLTRIELRIYLDANSRLSAIKAGEVDALVELGAVLPAQAGEIRDDPDFQVSAHASACSTHLAFNGTRAPFDDVKLRQAISLAIDRDAFVNDLLSGYGVPAEGIMISPNTTWKTTDPDARLTYDPVRAQELAQEALGGERVRATLVFTPPFEGINAWPFPLMAAYLQAILQPLGLDIELRQLETAALTDARNAGDFDIAIANNCWATGDPNYILRRLTGSDSALHTTQHGGYNNPTVDALLDEAMVETDPERQAELYREIQAIANVELPIVPLFDQQTIIAARENVRGLSQRIAYAPTFETIYLVD